MPFSWVSMRYQFSSAVSGLAVAPRRYLTVHQSRKQSGSDLFATVVAHVARCRVPLDKWPPWASQIAGIGCLAVALDNFAWLYRAVLDHLGRDRVKPRGAHGHGRPEVRRCRPLSVLLMGHSESYAVTVGVHFRLQIDFSGALLPIVSSPLTVIQSQGAILTELHSWSVSCKLFLIIT